MRLVTLRDEAGLSLGVVRDGLVFRLPASREWPSSMRLLAGAGVEALAAIAEWVSGAPGGVALSSVRLAAPIPDPGKIVGIGLNYADHAAEGNVAIPSAPLVFAKFTTTIVGPDGEVAWDRGLTDRVDYEAELGVVIGASARFVSESTALEHVFGYTCVNDVSARDVQFGDGQWVRGKSLDTFCPVGPWIVTADEIPDPQALPIACLLNGTAMQDSTTANMVFGVRTLIAYCSQAFTLEPGDLIATGTPAGVGIYKKPPRLLRDGDEMVIRIGGIGDLRNTCRVTGSPAGG